MAWTFSNASVMDAPLFNDLAHVLSPKVCEDGTSEIYAAELKLPLGPLAQNSDAFLADMYLFCCVWSCRLQAVVLLAPSQLWAKRIAKANASVASE